MPQITMKEIAKRAGVSQPLVSLILNDNKKLKVSDKSKKKVLKIARELNYHPNYMASSLRSGKRNCIGVAGAAHLDRTKDPVVSAIYSGIGSQVEEQGNFLTLIPQATQGRDTYENILLRVAKSRMVDGIIMFIFPRFEEEFPSGIGLLMQEEKIPFVPVFFTDYKPEKFYSVGYNSFAAGKLATRHLIDQGETDIFAIAYDNIMGRGFYDGYEQVIKEAGLKVQCQHETGCMTEEDFHGDDLVMKIINEHRIHHSYITCLDPLAYKLIKILADRGKRVPDDLRIVSCGNAIPEREYSPVITMVDRKFEEIGQKAAEFLFEQINNPEAKPKHFVAEPELIIRQSSVKIKS